MNAAAHRSRRLMAVPRINSRHVVITGIGVVSPNELPANVRHLELCTECHQPGVGGIVGGPKVSRRRVLRCEVLDLGSPDGRTRQPDLGPGLIWVGIPGGSGWLRMNGTPALMRSARVARRSPPRGVRSANSWQVPKILSHALRQVGPTDQVQQIRRLGLQAGWHRTCTIDLHEANRRRLGAAGSNARIAEGWSEGAPQPEPRNPADPGFCRPDLG